MDRSLTKDAVNFINEDRLHKLIKESREDKIYLEEIFNKSLNKEPLTIEETAQLIAINSPEMLQKLFDTAQQLKKDIYGNRIVLFAPLYIGNYCINYSIKN